MQILERKDYLLEVADAYSHSLSIPVVCLTVRAYGPSPTYGCN